MQHTCDSAASRPPCHCWPPQPYPRKRMVRSGGSPCWRDNRWLRRSRPAVTGNPALNPRQGSRSAPRLRRGPAPLQAVRKGHLFSCSRRLSRYTGKARLSETAQAPSRLPSLWRFCGYSCRCTFRRLRPTLRWVQLAPPLSAKGPRNKVGRPASHPDLSPTSRATGKALDAAPPANLLSVSLATSPRTSRDLASRFRSESGPQRLFSEFSNPGSPARAFRRRASFLWQSLLFAQPARPTHRLVGGRHQPGRTLSGGGAGRRRPFTNCFRS